MKNLTLIIPAKNEEDSLPQVLEEIKNYECDKIVILEESDLQTIDSIKNFNCKLIYQTGRGYGNALIEGLNNVKTEYTCIFNADGSFNPKYLKDMLDLCKDNRDFVDNSNGEIVENKDLINLTREHFDKNEDLNSEEFIENMSKPFFENLKSENDSTNTHDDEFLSIDVKADGALTPIHHIDIAYFDGHAPRSVPHPISFSAVRPKLKNDSHKTIYVCSVSRHF